MSAVAARQGDSQAAWRHVSLGDICSKPQYGWTTKAKADSGGLKLLRTTDITSGQIDWTRVPFCTELPPDPDKYLLREGDILISRAGSVGVSHLVTSAEPSVFASYLIRFRPGPDILPKYLAHFLKSPAYWKQIADNTAGIAIPNVNASKLQELRIPLAPIEEQRRIVAEIENQLSRLDEAVANLKRVKASLKRYKAAVLKAAVEGRLVPSEAELARSEGRTYETGAQLLQRVIESQRQGNRNYREPVVPDVSDLPSLPEGWAWSTFASVAERVTVGHVGPMKDEYVEQGVPFLRSQNVRANRFDPDGLKFVSKTFHRRLRKSALRPGDIVVVRSGSVGVSCVIPDHLADANCSDLVIVKAPRGVLPAFGAYYMNSVVDTRIAAGRVGVALTHFNTQSVAELPLPIPPMAEQHRIITEVDHCLSLVQGVEVAVDVNLTRSARLRQATLARSFGA
ncbi:MAG: restriction endonuclease subunit S [Burkholderiales bacterium]|nr:restriction endonuclease subunit S [Burkholderiales bacterium]